MVRHLRSRWNQQRRSDGGVTMLWTCVACGCRYAPAARCPQCGSDEIEEQSVPKINRHGVPSLVPDPVSDDTPVEVVEVKKPKKGKADAPEVVEETPEVVDEAVEESPEDASEEVDGELVNVTEVVGVEDDA